MAAHDVSAAAFPLTPLPSVSPGEEIWSGEVAASTVVGGTHGTAQKVIEVGNSAPFRPGRKLYKGADYGELVGVIASTTEGSPDTIVCVDNLLVELTGSVDVVAYPSNGWQALAQGVNSMWAHLAPQVVCDIARPGLAWLKATGQNSYYRFPTPFGLISAPSWTENKVEVWVLRAMPIGTGGTWTLRAQISGGGSVTKTIDDEGVSSGKPFLLGEIALDPDASAGIQTLRIDATAASGDVATDPDSYILGVMVVPSRSITALPATSGGNPHTGGVVFLPDAQLAAYGGLTVHFLQHARRLLEKIEAKRQPMIASMGYQALTAAFSRRITGVARRPPGVDEAKWHIRALYDEPPELSGSADLVVDFGGEVWTIDLTDTATWYSHDFEGLTQAEIPWSVEMVQTGDGFAIIEGLSAWFDEVK